MPIRVAGLAGKGVASISEDIAPVLILAFNRPELFEVVLDSVIAAGPSAIYVAVDGPRSGNSRDFKAHEEIVRTLDSHSTQIEIRRLIRKTNLGCRDAVSSAITWFFDHETQGIILEDDCHPHQSFFRYCSELLTRFKDDPSVLCISGHRGGPAGDSSDFSYSLSRYPQIWGWATWKRVWDQYDPVITDWPVARGEDWAPHYPHMGRLERRFWSRKFDEVYQGVVDTWDYQFTYLALKLGGLTIIPRRNLVINVGFDDRATHTRKSRRSVVARHVFEADFPLRSPAELIPSSDYDRWLLRVNYRVVISTLFGSTKSMLRRIRSGFSGPR